MLPALDPYIALPRYEGHGVTPLEAMARGVPVILSDAGLFHAFVGGGVAGEVAVADTAAAICSVRDLLTDTDRQRALAVAARERAREQFSVGAESEAITRVNEELLAEAGR